MNKFIRFLIALALVIGIAALAGGGVAWADRSAEHSQSANAQALQSVSNIEDDDCDDLKNKQAQKECKEKKKEKKGKPPSKADCSKIKDKQEKKECKRSVKPPPGDLLIPVTGEYSVGGFCTLRIELTKPGITLDAKIQTPLPGPLPENVHQVLQGCLLTYYSSNQRLYTLPLQSGETTICFAAIPNQEMTFYFYTLDVPNPVWTPLPTTSENGIACAPGNDSGVYVATFETP